MPCDDELAGFGEQSVGDALEAEGVEAAECEFFEAVSFCGFLGLVKVEVLVEGGLEFGVGDGVLDEGGVGEVDAELEGVAGGGFAALGRANPISSDSEGPEGGNSGPKAGAGPDIDPEQAA